MILLLAPISLPPVAPAIVHRGGASEHLIDPCLSAPRRDTLDWVSHRFDRSAGYLARGRYPTRDSPGEYRQVSDGHRQGPSIGPVGSQWCGEV